MKTQSDHEGFIKYRAEGLSIESAAGKVGISKRTGLKWEQKHADIIEGLKEQGINAVAEQFRVSREKRLVRLASFLDQIDTELETRDLSKVDTVDIIAMKLKTIEVIGKLVDPRVVGSVSVSVSVLDRYKEILIECGFKEET
jgi:transposase